MQCKNAAMEIEELMNRKQKTPDASSSFFQKSKFAMTRKGFDDLMDRLRLNNDTLDRLINQSNELEPSRQERRRRKEAHFFKHVQQCATAMIDAVSTALSCTCPETHTLSLSLSSRGSRTKAGKVIRDEKDVDFPVIISHDVKNLLVKGKSALLWSEINFRLAVQEDEETSVTVQSLKSITTKAKHGTFRSVSFSGFMSTTSGRSSQSYTSIQITKPKIQHTDSDQTTLCSQTSILDSQANSLTVSSTASQQILDLCQTLRSIDTTKANDCLGILAAQDTSFQVLPSTLPHDILDFETCFISLRTVLCQKHSDMPDFFRADKLRIAVAVASSVLQFYGSKWLENDWSANGVYFVRRKARDLFEQAFVSKALLAKDALNCEAKATPMPFIRNATLFSLGILLIELCLGRIIEQLQLPEDLLLGEVTPVTMANYSTAQRLLQSGQLSKEASLRYQSAVNRCIYCNFDQESTSLENDQFRQAVYDGVVAPLEQDLMAFEGPLGT